MADSADVMKKKYYEMLYEAAKHKIQKVLMRKKWIVMMIHRVKDAKKILESEGLCKLPETAKDALATYDVVELNNEDTLVLKGKTNKIVIPLEESFEIVYKAHMITRHGNCTEMNKWLSEAFYVVAMICTPVLYGVCQECLLGTADAEITLQDTYKSSALINLMDMSLQPDKSFRYLLTFQDLKTKFVQLRPLTANDLVDEIAMELTKLFCDFFPPLCLVVQLELIPTFELVLDRLNQIFDPKIALHSCKANSDSINMEVEMRITKWMTEHSSGNWAVGCHIVQWEINNKKTDNGNAYEKFFGLDQSSNQGSEIEQVELVPLKQTNQQSVKRNAKEFTVKKGQTVRKVQDIVEDFIQKNLKEKFKREQETIRTIVSVQNENKKTQNNPEVIEIDHDNDEHISTSNSEIINCDTNDTFISELNAKEPKENETHICYTCMGVIDVRVYFCCVCKNSLHLYCGARKQSPNNKVETICFSCVNK